MFDSKIVKDRAATEVVMHCQMRLEDNYEWKEF